MKIDFVISGFQKCGTTSLHNYLREQSSIYMPEEKEMYFYSRDNEVCNRKSYFDRFFKDVSSEDIIGFSDVDLIMSDEALDKVLLDHPNVKFILVIRDPVERAISAYNFEFSKGREKNSNILDALASDYKSEIFGYISRSLYTSRVDSLLSKVEDKKVLLIDFNEMKNDKIKTIKRAKAFLSDRSVMNVPSSIENKTRYPRFKVLNNLIHSRGRNVDAILSFIPDKVKLGIKKRILKPIVNFNNAISPPAVNDRIKDEIREKYFVRELELLEEKGLFNRNEN